MPTDGSTPSRPARSGSTGSGPLRPATAADGPPLLEMRGIGKRFPGVIALQDVSLSVSSGEVVALLGENGAGKSTLINVLSGVFPGYDGSILIDGRPAAIHHPTDAQRLGISTIHQELNLVPDMSIADNIWLGREQSSGGFIRRRRSHADARALLERVGLRLNPRRLVRQCRVAEQQLIEVAKALSLNARVLIMDEPTSALADAEVRRLFDVIGSLTADGVAIIYISHRLEELEEIADSVNVLRDGRWIGARAMEGTSRDDLIRMMVGRSVADLPRRTATDRGADPEVRLRVRDLSLPGDARAGRVALRGVGLDVHPGEIVGLAGLMGAGRTETLESIFGAYPGRSVTGRIELSGRRYQPISPAHAIANGLVLVAEDRKLQSLLLDSSVKFNASLSALRKFVSVAGFVNKRAERRAVTEEVTNLGVKTPSINTRIGTLSGGNQQKVVLAKGLLTQPQLILLDEPTRGIDVGAKSEIYELVGQLAQQGVSFLVASSELPELLRMCDRIIVLCEGRVSDEMNADEADQERILSAAMARSSVTAAS